MKGRDTFLLLCMIIGLALTPWAIVSVVFKLIRRPEDWFHWF